MFRYFTLDSFEVKDRVVGVRVDVNSPVIDGEVVMNERFSGSVKTLKELIKRGAKVVLLAHQGRRGGDDFVSLLQHAKIFEKLLGKKVFFSKEIYSKKVVDKIKRLRGGEILLVENLRFFDDETKPDKRGNLILKLAESFDLYVLDAFSVSHRDQTSVSRISKIPVIAGLEMERELEGLNEILKTPRPRVFVFGGAKPEDLIDLLETSLRKKEVDKVLLSGVIGELALYIKGIDLGKKVDVLKKKGYFSQIPRLRKLLSLYPKVFEFPLDLAFFDGRKRVEVLVNDLKKRVGDFSVFDVGERTARKFSDVLKGVGSVYFKGPAGDIEDKNFRRGTELILKGVVNSGAFSFMGGGHSVTSAKMFGVLNKFSYVSLAGGALVHFLRGDELIGVRVLEESFGKFRSDFGKFVVVGSNVLDLTVPYSGKFSDISAGDKIRIGEDFERSVGGGGVNVSVCVSRLGGGVSYLGKLSEEDFSEVERVFYGAGVRIIKSKVTPEPCSKSFIIDAQGDNDRVIFNYRGQNSDLSLRDFSFEDVLRGRYFYFSSLTGRGFLTLIDVAKKIRAKKKRSVICLSLSSYLIKNEKRIRDLVGLSDVVILNYDEAQMLVGKGSYERCLKRIYGLGPRVVVVTDGSKGSYAYDGKRKYFQKSFKVKVEDTTGAGDAFAGTFFYFYCLGYGVEKALFYGAKNSASVISIRGSQNGLLKFDKLVGK